MASAEIDIFRDPLYEERGFIFDPERNQYYEIVDHPEYGPIRSYISPRDQSPVPLLSDARKEGDYREFIAALPELKKRFPSNKSLYDALKSGAAGVTEKDFDEFRKMESRSFQDGGTVDEFDIFDYLPSAGQAGYYGSMLLPGTGILEAGGGMAAPPASDSDLIDAFSSEERLPSIGENIDRGEYFDAAMQGLGVLGDAMYAIPVAGAVTGPTLGTVAKGAGALGKAGARGLESLTFSIEELTKKFMDDQPPVGSIDPEKATGAPITERDIKTRANKYKKSLKKPAVKRREDARAAHEIQDLEAQERVIIDPNELAGYSLVPVTGDRSGIGTITDVKGVPLSFPVEVQGGPGYTQFMDYGKAWASMKNAANLKQINMIKALEETGLPPLGVYSAMAREGINFSTPVALSMVGQLDFLKIPKKTIASFDKAVRTGTATVKGIPDFVGLESPDLIPQLLGEFPSVKTAGDIRKALVAEMKKPTRAEEGFPIYDDVVETLTVPELRTPAGVPNPAETGYTIFKGAPEKEIFPDPYHLSYDTVIPGDYMGGLAGIGVPPELMFPQAFKQMEQSINVAGKPFTRDQRVGALRSRHIVEPVTDELIENLANYLNRTYGTKYAEGGSVNVEDQDIFEYSLGGSVSEMMGRSGGSGLTPAQAANIAGSFFDPFGATDITGNYPEVPNDQTSFSEMVVGERAPSLVENIREGNVGTAFLQGIGAIPLLGGAVKAGLKLNKLRKLSDPEEPVGSIKAYQGSPNRIPPSQLYIDKQTGKTYVVNLESDAHLKIVSDTERFEPIGEPKPLGMFDDGKIGTGEGAQGYGRGHYFAEVEDVAKEYRDRLTPRDYDYEEQLYSEFKAAEANNDYTRMDLLERAMMHETPKDFRELADDLDYDENYREAARQMADELEATGVNFGNIYEVDIKANLDEFIDYDVPLAQQSEKIQKAMKKFGVVDPETPGNQLYYKILDPDTPTQLAPEKATEKLKEAGVKGVKFADQFSRDTDRGTRNFVVFDPRIVEIAKRYGIAAPVAAAVLASQQELNDTDIFETQ